MSSRNGVFKDTHRDSKRSSGSHSSPSSKKRNKALAPPSAPASQARKQSSFWTHLTDSVAARDSSLQMSRQSNAATVEDSTSGISQTFSAYVVDPAYAHVDLLEVSAWTYPYQSPHHYEDVTYQSYDNTQTLTCPYHVSKMGREHNAASPGYGLGPLERWLGEDLRDGGALALQLGHQLRVDCTCTAMQSDVGMDIENRTKRGVASED